MTTEKRSEDTTGFITPSFWECDSCHRILAHGEFRFNCTICSDYDQCETCVSTISPPHPHQLVREIAYGYVEEVETTRVDLAARIQSAIVRYQDRYCMGVRDVNPNDPKIYANSYTWQTFKTIGERITNFGHGLRHFIKPRTHVGIFAANRPEWFITDFACVLHSFISVPMYCLFTDQEITSIINNVPLTIVVCDSQMLPRLLTLRVKCLSVKQIVCMDPIPDTMLGIKGISIHDMATIERYGLTRQYDYTLTKPSDCTTIVYTSGSTGAPKGAMISEYAYRKNFSVLTLTFRNEHVRLCYRPLAWSTDRKSSTGVFLAGGRIGFSSGDVTRLMEEVTLVRPTSFSAAPAIWNKIYSEYKATLSLMTVDRSEMDAASIEENLLQRFSTLIPRRCRVLSIGGAMVSPVVLDFMKRCFRLCQVMESYGATECGAISYDNIAETSLDYRIESVPSMGYTTNDKPYPRGELFVKTDTMFSGYINNPEETAMAMTDEGFFRTGDIVEIRSINENQPVIRVIDRKKNFFKLAQGQFVSPEILEGVYMQSPFVEQIYIYGNPLQDSVVAVVVPNKEYAQAFVVKHSLSMLDNNHPNKLFYNTIMQNLRSLAEKNSLRPHEIPSRLIIDFESFKPENGLLTSSMKLCRYKLAMHYSDRLKAVESIEHRLASIIERVVGHEVSTDETGSLLSIGNDSLAAVRLSRMIQENLGVSLPFNVLFDSNMNIENLASIIKDSSQISSLLKSASSQLLNDAMQGFHVNIDKIKSSRFSPSTIFVTGTTGFVGAFLLAELLKVYSSVCNFICLVRCNGTTKPMDRLQQNMRFLQLWNEEFLDRLIALDGDLTKERFGLDQETYSSLAGQTDIIFHCGALVNFVLPYSELYGSNVFGTLEVIRFATHASACIPVEYVSTLSVLPLGITDEIHIDEISLNHLKTGYAQSKWVAEKIVARAIRLGLPVNIYRLGSIWGDTDTGACNQNDINTLLLAAIMKTNCYPTNASHFEINGLPANFAAQSIVSLSRREPTTYGKIYHVVQSNEGIPFQRIIQSIQECGIVLACVSYDDWTTKLMSQTSTKRPFESILEFFTSNLFERIGSPKRSMNNKPVLMFPMINDVYVTRWVKFVLQNIVN